MLDANFLYLFIRFFFQIIFLFNYTSQKKNCQVPSGIHRVPPSRSGRIGSSQAPPPIEYSKPVRFSYAIFKLHNKNGGVQPPFLPGWFGESRPLFKGAWRCSAAVFRIYKDKTSVSNPLFKSFRGAGVLFQKHPAFLTSNNHTQREPQRHRQRRQSPPGVSSCFCSHQQQRCLLPR